MNSFKKLAIVLNTVTAPSISGPAVSPETLRNFHDPRYGFFQNYHLRSRSGSWFGQLKNMGFQYPVPNTLLLPPSLAEQLGLDNEDAMELMPAHLGEVSVAYFTPIEDPSLDVTALITLKHGSELCQGGVYLYKDTPIEVVESLPVHGFIGSYTELLPWDSTQYADPTPLQFAAKVRTEPSNPQPPTQRDPQ